MAKKSSAGPVGGILLLLGALVYLYVVFAWYGNGAAASSWLASAQFLSPFVAAVAVVSAISLFFMSIGTMAGKMADKMMNNVLWKFIIGGGVAILIVTGGGSSFWPAVVAFLLTYIGAMVASM